MSKRSKKLDRLPNSDSEEEKTQPKNQRIFAESDETKLLKTYLKLVSKNPDSSSSSTIVVTSPIMEAIEASLSFKFSHTQIIDKLRRLRLKYHRQARTKSLIKTSQDRRIFSLSREIWGKKKKSESPAKISDEDGLVREEFRRALPRNRVWEIGLESLGRERVRVLNQDWDELMMEEIELVTRKTELVNEFAHLLRLALAQS